jgi:hypothetical protein
MPAVLVGPAWSEGTPLAADAGLYGTDRREDLQAAYVKVRRAEVVMGAVSKLHAVTDPGEHFGLQEAAKARASWVGVAGGSSPVKHVTLHPKST